MQYNFFTEKIDINLKILFISFLTIMLTGINGLVTYSLLMFFSRIDLGIDSNENHGLVSGASRLGGFAVMLSVIIAMFINIYLFEFAQKNAISGLIKDIIVISVIIGSIGLVEDLKQNLSSKLRLIVMLIIISLGLYAIPELLPFNLMILNYIPPAFHSFIVPIVSVLMICGFINAGNFSDGANGLLSTIFLGFFVFAYSTDNSIFNFSMIMTLVAFIIFNVSTGKIFLGDFGSYSLSSLVAFTSLYIHQRYNVAIFLLASILVYPCFEITRSLIVRISSRKSVMSPDNMHLHNYLNNYLLRYTCNRHLVNSTTGLTIGFITTLPPLIIYFFGLPIQSNSWKLVFLIQILFLMIIYTYFLKKFSRSNKSLL